MILKYVLKNFTRRKVRTILMILSLVVSTGLIITMSATVDTIRQSGVDLVVTETGRADFTLKKKDTSLDRFMPIDEATQTILNADERITAVHPRIELAVEFPIADQIEFATMVGLDSANDNIGTVTVMEGEYKLGDNQVALYEFVASNNGLQVGDVINVSHILPPPRELGKEAEAGTSSSRIQRQFTVAAIVRQDGVTQGFGGILVDLADLQAWVGENGRSNQLVASVEQDLYNTNNSEVAAVRVRDVVREVQKQFSEEYIFDIPKVSAISGLSQGFLALQALINTYGLISLGVVGLLVYTLVMTNVQEQKRDMAVLRILGSQRGLLFGLVIVEVVVIGIVGIGLGILLGQAITAYVLVPLLTNFLEQEGITLQLAPSVSLGVLLPPVISAFTVLILSSLKPANEASRTKVMHAINPGVADNIQLEDLTQLRERRPSGRLFWTGIVLMFIFILLTSFEFLGNIGGPALEVVFGLMALMMLVVGISFVFFITTVPFEKLVVFVLNLINPRLTYFAGRNVSRGRTLNTLISLLVLFSAVLPAFLGTNVQLDLANNEVSTQMRLGAPLLLQYQPPWFGNSGGEPSEESLYRPSLVENELTAVPTIEDTVGMSYPFSTTAQDTVGLRRANVGVLGLNGDLRDVIYSEMIDITAGSPNALGDILNNQNGAIISEGLAEYLAVELGDTIQIEGKGLDNSDRVEVIAIARRIPGIAGITRSRLTAEQGQTAVLVSMPHFRQLITELDAVPPEPDARLIQTVYATTIPDAQQELLYEELDQQFDDVWFYAQLVDQVVEENRQGLVFFTTFLTALTGISFVTAVFSVFAVIFVSIYARRLEIGMLKSMGMLRRELNGMLILEAIAMTLGSVLAGIAAGATMAYVNYYISQVVQQQLPYRFAADTVIIPAMVVIVVLVSMLGAGFSARRIVRKRAVEILRM